MLVSFITTCTFLYMYLVILCPPLINYEPMNRDHDWHLEDLCMSLLYLGFMVGLLVGVVTSALLITIIWVIRRKLQSGRNASIWRHSNIQDGKPTRNAPLPQIPAEEENYIELEVQVDSTQSGTGTPVRSRSGSLADVYLGETD